MIIEVNILNELVEFLNTDEVHIVIAVAVAICILGTLYFIVEKSYNSKRKKRNTKELNELVERLEDKNNAVIEKPVIEEIIEPVTDVKAEKIDNDEKSSPQAEVIPLKVVTVAEKKQEVPLVIPIEEFEKKQDLESTTILEAKEEQNVSNSKDSVTDIYEKVKDEIETLDLEDNKNEELQYTDAFPNQEEAKEELRKATIELLKTQEKEQQEESKNIELTEFEEEQEKNAIISVQELMKKGDILYEQNEVTQYADEGDEPISLQDLEMRMNNIKEEAKELDIKQQEPEIIESKPIDSNKAVLDDFYSIDKTKAYNDDHVFKSSPIISPIFGIEKQSVNDNSLELENTANYDKLDEEIKKTNEFLGKLRELQKNLD